MNTMNLINAALAAPKTHSVITEYADGVQDVHETRNLAAAENWLIGQQRKIGRDLISRATGETVRIVKVWIETL